MKESKRRSVNSTKDTPRSRVVKNRLPMRINRTRILEYTRRGIYRAKTAIKAQIPTMSNVSGSSLRGCLEAC